MKVKATRKKAFRCKIIRTGVKARLHFPIKNTFLCRTLNFKGCLANMSFSKTDHFLDYYVACKMTGIDPGNSYPSHLREIISIRTALFVKSYRVRLDSLPQKCAIDLSYFRAKEMNETVLKSA